MRILVATGVLAAALGSVRFLDLGAMPAPIDAPTADAQVAPIALPAEDIAAAPATAQHKLTQPLPLPTIDTPSHAAATPAVPDSVPTQAGDTAADTEQPATTAAPSLLAGLVAPGTDEPAAIVEPATVSTLGTTDPPAEAAADVATPESPAIEPRWVEHTVAKGESLARIFQQQELDPALLHRIVTSSKQAKSLANIRPGQRLRFQYDENGELARLELHRNRVESLRIAIADDEIGVEEISKAIDKRVASAAGVIESSLFVDGQKAGLSDGLIMELATVFGWDIDFALEIRAGDQFRVLFEEHYLDGEKLRDGSILAAEFTNRGTTHRAVRYEDSEGEIGYYDVDGHNKRRAFIRTPIRFARVSSRYNPRRWHPVLKRWRSHKGVDYAAPRGTPVKATGDGRVVHRGNKGGYGKTVILEHAGKYTTLYAHLSQYSKRARPGTRVKQGQVIGYVGKTGLATGPHLHYEFRVNGVHKDPLRVKLPKTVSLPKSELGKFRETTAPLLARLEQVPAETMVASADTTQTR